MKKLPILVLTLLSLTLFAGVTSCSKSEERKIQYVTPVVEHNRPVDSLIMELDGLMQNYAALESRGRNGEDVMAAMRAIQARMTDFGLKMEAVMHDMSEEDIDVFTQYYDNCLRNMGMMTEPTDSFDVAY
ncbi:MAG: hypothetical protein MJZ35_04835 [Bacteroidaceae bacterium]|nr:hypothetical protein [Bacteroidaceae bacterium]